MMMNKAKLLVLAGTVLLASCGGGGGGGAELRSAFVTIEGPPGAYVESDVLKDNSCSTGGGLYVTDNPSFTFRTTTYPGYSGKVLPVYLDSYTVTFEPLLRDGNPEADELPPPIKPLTVSSVGTLLTRGDLKVNLAMITDDIKSYLVNEASTPISLCSLDMLRYRLHVTFNVVEVGGGHATVTTTLEVAIADRNNKA